MLILVYNENYKFSLFQASFHIGKCKDHYVDCYNVVSYEISDACSKLKAILYYVSSFSSTTENKFIDGCPIYVRILFNVSFGNI